MKPKADRRGTASIAALVMASAAQWVNAQTPALSPPDLRQQGEQQERRQQQREEAQRNARQLAPGAPPANAWNAVPASPGDILNLRDIEQAFPFRFNASVDNSGTKATGRYQGSATVSYDIFVSKPVSRPAYFRTAARTAGFSLNASF